MPTNNTRIVERSKRNSNKDVGYQMESTICYCKVQEISIVRIKVKFFITVNVYKVTLVGITTKPCHGDSN